MKRWPSHIALVALVTATSLFCPAVPAQQSLSKQAFETLKTEVQAELDARYRAAQIIDEIFPGATVAVGLPDGRVAEFAIGFADVEQKVSMSCTSRMPSGSIGKTFVAAVSLSMVAEGSLDLDGKIAKWLGDEPWFQRLPNHDAITLRHLLNHSSGIIDHVFDPDSGFPEYFRQQLTHGNAESTVDPQQLVQFVLDRKPLFTSGGGFHYSDTGYILVGLIIEKASDSTYYQELTSRFLVPLGLSHTAPFTRRETAGLAQGYAPESLRLLGLPPKVLNDGLLVFDPSLEWTGGGLVTTSRDLARWTLALFGGRAINSQSLKEMLHSVAVPEQIADEATQTFGYGLGVSIAHTRHGVAYRHGGFFPGYNSLVIYYPKLDIALTMQINADKTEIEKHVDAIAEIVVRIVTDIDLQTAGNR